VRRAGWLWLVCAGLAVVVLQLTIADELTIGGLHPELVWVLPVAAGLAAGPRAGMAAGLVGGAMADLFVPTPYGLTALVGVFVGYALGRLGEEGVGDLGGAAWFVAPALAFGAGLVSPVAYALFGAALGHSSYVSVSLGLVCLLDAVASAVLVRLVMRVLGPLVAADTSRSGPLEPVRGAM
jgi:rod shape-determining protein MreD